MAKYCFVVLSNPKRGRDAEYNSWYTKRHLRDVLAVPGFVGAQRFRLRASKGGGKGRHKYLALYEIETNDIRRTLKEMYSRAGTAAMPISKALDLAGVSTGLYRAMTPRVTRR